MAYLVLGFVALGLIIRPIEAVVEYVKMHGVIITAASLLSAAAILAWIIQNRISRSMRRKSAYNHISRIAEHTIEQYKLPLVSKRRTLVTKGEYGQISNRRYIREICVFYEHALRPRITYYLVRLDDADGKKHKDFFCRQIRRRVNELYNEELTKSDSVGDDFTRWERCEGTGHEFEEWCANRLRALGWNAFKTKGSGDGGGDIVAERNGIKIIVQCKLYRDRVANKAVQEVFTAKAIYGTHYAFVVAPNGYQISARKAAGVTGVRLISHRDIDNIESYV